MFLQQIGRDAKETPSGAQDKVNLHANNTDIHVTKIRRIGMI